MPRGRQQRQWPALAFETEPRLVTGRRSSSKYLSGWRFELQTDVYPDLAEICRPLVAFLETKPSRAYQPFAEIEQGEEYLTLDIDDLPKHPVRKQRRTEAEIVPAPEDDVADLVAIVRGADGLDSLDRTQIESQRFSFYAICWQHGASSVGFVTKTSPVVTMTTGRRYFRYEDALRYVERPNVVLTDRVDMFIGDTTMAVLNTSAFRTLFSDVQIAMIAVPKDVAEISRQLKLTIPLSKQATSALEQAAGSRLSFARRLHELRNRVGTAPITVELVRQSMAAHGLDPGTLLDDKGGFSFGTKDVERFLDVLEGRYFEDDLTKEHRRADRFSTRQ